MSLHLMHRREFRANAHEQMPLPSGEQPSFPIPYIQGIGSILGAPSSFSGATLSALPLHRDSTSSFPSHKELSYIEPVIDSDQSLFDEPPLSYINNVQVVYPPGAVLSVDHFLNVEPNTSSPPTHFLSQVLKHESLALPLTDALHSHVSSLAHSLEPQDRQTRQTPWPYTPAFGDRASSYSISTNATQMSSTSLTPAAGDPRSTLAQVPFLAGRAPAPAQLQEALGSSEAPPTARVSPPAHNLSVVAPLHAHTLAHPFPEVPNHDYDMFLRLRKLQPALQGSGKEPVYFKEEYSAMSSPLSSLSCPSSLTGAPAAFSKDSKSTALESAFASLTLGRKHPALQAKLVCLCCRRRKIQCHPPPCDRQDTTCQQCEKRRRECGYPEMTWRGQGRKRSHPEDLEESDYEKDSRPPTKTRRGKLRLN